MFSVKKLVHVLIYFVYKWVEKMPSFAKKLLVSKEFSFCAFLLKRSILLATANVTERF